jgi:hypothetical protein
MTKNLTTLKVFENFHRENLSEILFPDKTKNLHGYPLFVAFSENFNIRVLDGKIYSKWIHFAEIVAEKLNANLTLIQIPHFRADIQTSILHLRQEVLKLQNETRMDIFINPEIFRQHDISCYSFNDYCFLVPLPPEHSIVELILILPLDRSCWLFLGITIAVSTLVWRIFEGHWNLLFGSFAFFVGHFIKIQT